MPRDGKRRQAQGTFDGSYSSRHSRDDVGGAEAGLQHPDGEGGGGSAHCCSCDCALSEVVPLWGDAESDVAQEDHAGSRDCDAKSEMRERGPPRAFRNRWLDTKSFNCMGVLRLLCVSEENFAEDSAGRF